MEYFTLKGGFFTHPKTKALQQKHGNEGIVSLTILWAATAEEHQDGIWRNMNEQDIARAADWHGDPQEFVSDLCEIGFLDKTPDGYAVHNWKKHQGLE